MARSSRLRLSHLVTATIAVSTAALLLPALAWGNTLRPIQTVATGKTPYSIAKGDVDGDTRTDIVVSNFNAGTVTVYYQQAAGGFSAADKTDLSLVGPVSPMPNPGGVGIGDVDGDGRRDVVAVDVASQFVYLWLQTAVPKVFTPAAAPFNIQTQMYPAHPGGDWIGTGNPGLPIGANPWSSGYQIAVGDLYGDTTAEIVVPNYYAIDGSKDDVGGSTATEWRGGRLRDGFRVTDTVTFVWPLSKEFGPHYPMGVALGDFNNDGLRDYLMAGFSGRVNYISNPGSAWSYDRANDIVAAPGLVRAAAGDVNADGLTDAVVTGRQGSGSWSLILQDDLGHLGGVPRTAIINQSEGYPVGVRIGDVNGDGLDDVVMANAKWDQVRGSLGVAPQYGLDHPSRGGLNPLSGMREFTVGRYPQDVEIGNFDADAQNEVIISNSNSSTFQLFDQVPPDPPGVNVVGSTGSASVSGASAAYGAVAAKVTVLWLSTIRPVVQLSEPSPPDLNGIVGYHYVLDQVAGTVPTVANKFVATGTALQLGPLTGGTWYLHAISKDRDGNVGTVPAHYQLNIDVTPPTAPTVSDGFGGIWSDSPARNVTFQASDSGAGIRDYLWAIDGGNETATNATSVALSNLADGEHIFTVKARDLANPANLGPAGTLAIRVDQYPPTCSITSPKEGALVKRDMVVSASADDAAGIKKVEFFIDGALKATKTSAPYTATVSTAGLSQGSHTLLVKATDMFGHEKDAARAINVDNISPRISGVYLSPNPFFPLKRDGYKDNMYIRYTVSERSTVRFTVYNRAKDAVAYLQGTRNRGRYAQRFSGAVRSKSTGKIYMLKEGTYYVNIKATDAAGNSRSTKLYRFQIRKYVVQILSGSRVRLIPR